MAADFQSVKKVDQRTRDIVNGFIKQTQSILPSNDNPYYNIPSLVFILTILYYSNPEYFTIHGENMKVNENKDVIECIRAIRDNNTVYGNFVITKEDKGKFMWTFKLYKAESGAIARIGIDSSNKKFANTDLTGYGNNENAYYIYHSYYVEYPGLWRGCNKIISHNTDLNPNNYGVYGYGCHEQSEVKMVLNMDNKTMTYDIHEQDQLKSIVSETISFENDEHYSMCISLNGTMSVQLSNFNVC